MVTVRLTVAGAPGETATVVELRVKDGLCLGWGAILVLSVMVPLNPLMLLIVMIVVLELPSRIFKLAGLAEIVKSGFRTVKGSHGLVELLKLESPL